MSELMLKTGRKFSKRSESHTQEEKIESMQAREAKRPKSDQALYEESIHNMLKDIRDSGVRDWSTSTIDAKIREVEHVAKSVSLRMKPGKQMDKIELLITQIQERLRKLKPKLVKKLGQRLESMRKLFSEE